MVTGADGDDVWSQVHPLMQQHRAWDRFATAARADKPFAESWACCEPRLMSPSAVDPPYDRFLATAEAVAAERPEVDLEMAREVFLEVATLLYNGLALDGLDEHDTAAVVDGLCIDLVAADPGAAVRARSAGDVAWIPETSMTPRRCRPRT